MKVMLTGRLFRLVVLAFCVWGFGTGCATNPVTGRKEIRLVPESQEIHLGTANYLRYQQAQGGDFATMPGITKYVESVGNKLVEVSDRSHLPYEFTVLNNSVPNAWALPGGKIAVNRGLLTELESEAELAAVLSHEIVHAAARHGAKSMERGILLQTGMLGLGLAVADHDYEDIIVGAGGVTAMLIGQKYSRGAESESDKYGIDYMVRAGYDPQAAVDLQETFVRLSEGRNSNWLTGLFASHPPSQRRVEANRETIKNYPSGGRIGEDTYQKMIAPLLKVDKAYDSLEEGYKALNKGQSAQALTAANQAIDQLPREAHAYGLAAKALIQQDKTRQALSYLDKALSLNDHYFEFYLQKGLVAYRQGDRRAARANLDKSIELLPTASAHFALGDMSLGEGRRDLALKHFRVAAGSNSPEGKKAKVKLALLELPENPEKYIQLSYDLDRNGYLVLSVRNRAPVHVKNCRLQVQKSDGGSKYYNVNRTIPPGAAYTIQTGIGPYASRDQVRNSTRAQIVRATAAQ